MHRVLVAHFRSLNCRVFRVGTLKQLAPEKIRSERPYLSETDVAASGFGVFVEVERVERRGVVVGSPASAAFR